MTVYRDRLRIVQSLCADNGADTFVYAIRVGEDGPVKVGIAKNPRERLQTLQTAHHEQLHGIALWRGGRDQEKLLHEVFADARLNGEWFKPTEELLGLVDLLGGYSCDWYSEDKCLMTDGDAVGTCRACGFQVEAS